MRVYHASPFAVERPDVYHSRSNLDFGKGFYVTELKNQAIAYARRFTLRGRDAFLNTYELDAGALQASKVLAFESYDEAWLDFVMTCRRGVDKTDWDVVMGGIANDKVFTTVDLYSAGEITKAEALGRLVYAKPNNQICLRSQELMDVGLRLIEAVKVK